MASRIVDTVSKLSLRKAKPNRLFDQAIEQIKTLILEGHLKPGDKLPSENELSQMLSVSRSSVREALRALEYSGFIEVRSGAGAFVSEDALLQSSINQTIKQLLGREDHILQLLQVRGAIECLAASSAATHATEEGLSAMSKILAQQDALINRGSGPTKLDELARLDAEFHLAVSMSSGNTIVHEIISVLIPAFIEDNKAILFVEKGTRLRDEHHEILDALTHHDPSRANAAMQRHIGRVISEVEKLLSDEGGEPV